MDSIFKYYLNNAEKINFQHGLNVCFVIFYIFNYMLNCAVLYLCANVLFVFLHGLLFFFI